MFTMKWFGHDNRTEALSFDYKLVGQFLIWYLVYLILIWFVITSRRRRVHTFMFGSISIFSGALLSIGMTDANWMSGEGQLKGSYSRWTQMKHGHSEMLVPADITLHIGLRSLNITFASKESEAMNFFYNENLEFERRVKGEESQMIVLLQKGLPNPILSVLEFIFLNRSSPCFEKAGYQTQYCLTLALVAWAIIQLINLFVPPVSTKLSFINGVWTLMCVLNYIMKIDAWNFHIYVEGSKVSVSLGRSVVLVTLSALLQLVPCLLVWLCIVPRTSFEVDFGTAWDRQDILDHQKARKEANCKDNYYKQNVTHKENFLEYLKKGVTTDDNSIQVNKEKCPPSKTTASTSIDSVSLAIDAFKDDTKAKRIKEDKLAEEETKLFQTLLPVIPNGVPRKRASSEYLYHQQQSSSPDSLKSRSSSTSLVDRSDLIRSGLPDLSRTDLLEQAETVLSPVKLDPIPSIVISKPSGKAKSNCSKMLKPVLPDSPVKSKRKSSNKSPSREQRKTPKKIKSPYRIFVDTNCDGMDQTRKRFLSERVQNEDCKQVPNTYQNMSYIGSNESLFARSQSLPDGDSYHPYSLYNVDILPTPYHLHPYYKYKSYLNHVNFMNGVVKERSRSESETSLNRPAPNQLQDGSANSDQHLRRQFFERSHHEWV